MKHQPSFSILATLFLSASVCLTSQVAAQTIQLDWGKRMGFSGFDLGTSITTDNLGNVYTVRRFEGTVDFNETGAPVNLTSPGSGDIYVTQHDANGALIWARHKGGSGLDAGNAIAVDNSGNVYIAGWFNGTVDFDPGVGTFNLAATIGGGDVFIIINNYFPLGKLKINLESPYHQAI